MKLQDAASGFALLALGGVLYLQTLDFNDAAYVDDINPMTYPRILALCLMCISAGIIVTGVIAPPPQSKDIPVISPRVLGICTTLLCGAAVFTTLGFVLTGVGVACGIAFTMGYRKKLFKLLCVNTLAVGSIWILFTYALRMPLPAGVIF